MIELRDVAVERPGLVVPILAGLSLRMEPGESVALLGGNGSGKTTLVRLLNGTQLPTRGQVLVGGRDTCDPASRRAVRRAVGLLFQDPDDQFVSTTAEREIAFGLENLGTPPAEMRRAVDTALQDFDLEVERLASPHEMSGGEKARLALACVWVMQPGAIVLDETESLLDRRGRERLAAALADLPSGTLILRVTTDVETAATASRVLVLHAGRLVADGSPDEVLTQLPADVVLRTGSPLAWRVSSQLARSGRAIRPTTSWRRLLHELSLPAPGSDPAPETPPAPGTTACGAAGAHDPAVRAEDAGTSVVGLAPAPSGEATRARNIAPGPGGACIAEPGTLARLQDVSFAYDTAQAGAPVALSGVTIQVRRGEWVALLGASGSGKSTLLHVLAGLLRPTRGRLEWAPRSSGLPSLVMQFPERQLFAETVLEEVAYGLRESGVRAPEVKERVEGALDEVGLPVAQFGGRSPFHLSAGEMRRLALAGALAQRRPLVLLDEPTLGLDAEGRERLVAILRQLRARGTTCWIASHDADFVTSTCERAVVLEAGRAAFDGPPDELWNDARRAGRLGIELPRTATLAEHLRAAGVEMNRAAASEEQLVAALATRIPVLPA